MQTNLHEWLRLEETGAAPQQSNKHLLQTWNKFDSYTGPSFFSTYTLSVYLLNSHFFLLIKVISIKSR